MKTLLIAAALAVLSVAPVAAQSAGGGLSANVNTNPIDASRLKGIGCKLGLTNPRGCIPSQATPSQPGGSSTRPSNAGGARPRR